MLLDILGRTVSATFANFTYTTKGSGETAKYTLILGASTEALYERDIVKLSRMLSFLMVNKGDATTILAIRELLASRLESLAKGVGNNSAYTNADTYDTIPGIKGVRVHKATGDVYVSGLVERKETIVPGTFKKVNSSPKTIAKRKVEKRLPSGRFRLFKLDNVTRAALHGDVLELVSTTP